jgi:hypothetical protein
VSAHFPETTTRASGRSPLKKDRIARRGVGPPGMSQFDRELLADLHPGACH